MHPTCSDCIHALAIDCKTLGVCSEEIVALKPCECRHGPPSIPRDASFFAEYPVVMGSRIGCGKMEQKEPEEEDVVDDYDERVDDFGYHSHS